MKSSDQVQIMVINSDLKQAYLHMYDVLDENSLYSGWSFLSSRKYFKFYYGSTIDKLVNYKKNSYQRFWKTEIFPSADKFFILINEMASSSRWKVLYLPKFYKLQITLVLYDVWQMGCYTDNTADGKAK